MNWPKAVELGNAESDVSVIPRMQGMLVPGNWPQAIEARDLCNSRSFYMPWWGQIRDGQGVQVILETSDDAGGTYATPPAVPHASRRGGTPAWDDSDITPARYIFDEHATYVTMCKRYRAYVEQRGSVVTLSEKLVRTPALAEVIGRPVVHLGALYHFVPQASLSTSVGSKRTTRCRPSISWPRNCGRSRLVALRTRMCIWMAGASMATTTDIPT